MSELITSPVDLQAEIERLKAENKKLKQTEGGAIVGGMSEPSNKIVTVINQQPFKGEKIISTVRTDQGYDPLQRFAGRQP